jgi:DDE family transposase
MKIPRAFEPFVQGAPCAVITRMVAEYVVDGELLAKLFQEHAVSQYDRKITIDQLVAVMLDVACGVTGSVRAAFLKRKEEIAASLTAFYGKLDRTDPDLGMALVAQVAERLGTVIHRLLGDGNEPLAGMASFILDGNMLAGTDHRLKPLRHTRAAALPGKSLALFECATGLVVQTVLWEDAHSQERALLPQLKIPSAAHLIADRNFCVRWFLDEIQRAGSFFTIRHHKQLVLPEGRDRRIGRCETGLVYERLWNVTDDQGQAVVWRIITVKLDQPTRDGETEIVLLSNLPEDIDARKIAAAYRLRWTIERHFQRLTDHLHCEIPTLGEPRAALFAFAMSLVAGNMLAVVIAALEAAHGKGLAENVSYHYLVDEVAGNYRGMMLVLPPQRWSFVRALSAKDFARLLQRIAGHANLTLLRKTRRGPKKKRHTPNCTNVRHLSTKRVLDKHRQHAC